MRVPGGETSHLMFSRSAVRAAACRAGLAAAVPVGGTPYGVAVNPVTDRIYAPDYYGNTVQVIDGVANAFMATVEVAGSNSHAFGIAVNPTTNRVYTAHYQDNFVSVIDGSTN